MIVLVLTIPFYVSSVMGASSLTIKATAVKGKATDTAVFRRSPDVLTIDATVQISNDTSISNQQVQVDIDGSGGYWFECTSGAASAGTCKYTEEGYTSGTHSYSVKLYDNSQTLLRSKSLSVTTDRLGAAVRSLSITPKLSKDGKVTIKYLAEDYSSSYGDTSNCVGIKKIELYKDDLSGQLLKTITPDDQFQCSISGSEEYQASGSGSVRICAKATDQFDQSSTTVSCDSFEIDNKAPVLKSVEVLRQDNNKPLKAIAYAAVPSKLMVNVTAADLDTSSVRVDASSLNEEYTDNLTGSCSQFGTTSVCEFEVSVRLSQSKSPSIKVYGKDGAGNAISPATKSAQQITFDDKGPVINSIGVKSGQLGNTWITGTKATFVADITETTGNLENGHIFLDMSGIGGGIDTADNCTGFGNNYKCYWYNRQVNVASGSSFSVAVTIDSEDDLGNKVDTGITATVKSDKASPKINRIRIDTIHGEFIIPGINYTAKGDRLNIYANVTEESDLRAFGDFSKAISTAKKVEGTCSRQEGNEWQCGWETDAVDKEGSKLAPYTAILYFKFSDFVGNNRTNLTKIVITSVKNETNPRYWTLSDVKCSPRLIDRQVTTLAEQRMYCNLVLSPIVAGAQTASVALDSSRCKKVGDVTYGDYVRATRLMNGFKGQTSLFFKIQLKTTTMSIDQIEYTCPISIYTMVSAPGKLYVVKNPQVENVTFLVQFYNFPLGEYSNNVKGDIDSIKNDIIVKADWIASLTKLMNVLYTLCSLLQTWNRIMTIWQAIQAILNGVAEVYKPVEGAATATRVAGNAADKAKETLAEKAAGWCKYVSCEETLWGPDYKEFQKTWNSWLAGKVPYYSEVLKLSELTNYGAMWPPKPKDSIVLSLGFGCLPGIIDGAQKWRQIQCNYGVCLRESVKQGVPLAVCQDQKAYLECKFIFGEVFQLIPFAYSAKTLGQMFANALKDPFTVIFGIATVACTYLLAEKWGHWFCIVVKIIKELTIVVQDLDNAASMFKNSFKPANDMCEVLNSE